MKKKEFLFQLELAIKNRDDKQVTDMLNPIIERTMEAILKGTLVKNVIRYFTNKGFSKEAAEDIVRVSKIRAKKFMKTKIK